MRFSPTGLLLFLARKFSTANADGNGSFNPNSAPRNNGRKLRLIETSFSNPCDQGTLIPPDGAASPEDSEYVAYCHGNATYGNCGGNCCIDGADPSGPACEGTNSWIRKDDSCQGFAACANATAGVISNSCHGEWACLDLGGGGGNVGQVISSCFDGHSACRGLGYSGNVTHIIESCNGGTYACGFLGYNGNVGSVLSSCEELFSCFQLGNWGNVGIVQSGSCKGDSSCYQLGYSLSPSQAGGNVGIVQSGSCKGYSSCYQLGSDGGTVETVTKSCVGQNACYQFARSGFVGLLYESCLANNSCVFGAFNSGSIQSIAKSCTTIFSCFAIGSNGTVGNIHSSCCGEGTNVCYDYCKGNNPQQTGVPCGEDMEYLDDNGLCPSESPSLSPSISSAPSASSIPTASAQPSSFGTSIRAMVTYLIGTVHGLESSFADMADDIDSISSATQDLPSFANMENNVTAIYEATQDLPSFANMENNVTAIYDATQEMLPSFENMENNVTAIYDATQEIAADMKSLCVEIGVDVTVLSVKPRKTIAVLVTVGGTETNADSNPSLFAFSQSNSGVRGEVQVADATFDNFGTGKYFVAFSSSEELFWLKVVVGGNEKTMMFRL